MRLFPNDFDKHPLRPPAVEFTVKNPLPRAEIEIAPRDRDEDLAAHDLALVMGVGVVLTGAVVLIALRRWIERGQLLKPLFIVRVQSRLVVVDKDAGRDVHRVYKTKPFAHSASLHRLDDLARNIHEVHSRGKVEGQLFTVDFMTRF